MVSGEGQNPLEFVNYTIAIIAIIAITINININKQFTVSYV